MENNKLELEDLDKQLAAVLLAQEVVAEALKNNPSPVVLSRCKELLAAETKKLLLLEYRLYVGESVDEERKSNSAESFELVGSVLKEATLMENEISQKLGEIPIDSSSEEVVPNSSENDLSFQFHEIAKTVVNDFVKKNFVEESFKQVLLTLTHKLLMGNCLSSTVNSSRCLFDRGKYKLKFDSCTLRSLYCTGFQIVDRLYREIVQKLVYQSGYQSNGFSGDSIDCMLENEGFITTAWYLFGKMLECEVMRRLFDRGKNFEAINMLYFTIHLPQLQFTSAIDTSASFQYTRLIFDRGRYVGESKLLDKYTDDLISKLDSACGYCLQLLSANSNEFAFDVLPSFNYGCILFDGGKLPEIMFWNYLPKGSDVDCSYFYQYHTYTGEIYFWLVCMCANRGKCSYCVLKFTGKVFDRGRLLELIQIQYACELFHEILQQVNFHCNFEYTASHEGWLDQFRSQVYHPADEWSSQVIRVYKLEEGVPWFHVYSLMVVFFIIKGNGLLEISMIVTEQIFQLIANMGKANYKVRIDEYLFIIITFDRGKVLDSTGYFYFCCCCCVFDLRAQCIKPLSFDISAVHSHGLFHTYLHASVYQLLHLGTDGDVCFIVNFSSQEKSTQAIQCASWVVFPSYTHFLASYAHLLGVHSRSECFEKILVDRAAEDNDLMAVKHPNWSCPATFDLAQYLISCVNHVVSVFISHSACFLLPCNCYLWGWIHDETKSYSSTRFLARLVVTQISLRVIQILKVLTLVEFLRWKFKLSNSLRSLREDDLVRLHVYFLQYAFMAIQICIHLNVVEALYGKDYILVMKTWGICVAGLRKTLDCAQHSKFCGWKEPLVRVVGIIEMLIVCKDVILTDKEFIRMGSVKWDANDDVSEPGHKLQIQLEVIMFSSDSRRVGYKSLITSGCGIDKRALSNSMATGSVMFIRSQLWQVVFFTLQRCSTKATNSPPNSVKYHIARVVVLQPEELLSITDDPTVQVQEESAIPIQLTNASHEFWCMTYMLSKIFFSVSVDIFKPVTRHSRARGLQELNASRVDSSFFCHSEIVIHKFEGKLIMLVLSGEARVNIISDSKLLRGYSQVIVKEDIAQYEEIRELQIKLGSVEVALAFLYWLAEQLWLYWLDSFMVLECAYAVNSMAIKTYQSVKTKRVGLLLKF